MTSLRLSNGNVINAVWIQTIQNGIEKLLVKLDSDLPLSRIAKQFEGVTKIEAQDEATPGVYEVYEGFDTVIKVDRDIPSWTTIIVMIKHRGDVNVTN